MLLIVLVHANYFSLGFIGGEDVRANPVSSFIRIFLEQLCVVGVNVFVLISGWFGIRPTVKGGISVLYQVFFYGLLVMCIGLVIGLPVPKEDMVRLLWLGGYYWYMPAYLGLYAFSPVLNTYMEHATPRIQLGVLSFFFVFEFLFGWLTKLGTYNAGFSFISFIGLYLLAGFVRNHSRTIRQWGPSRHISLFLILTLLSGVVAFLDYKYLGGRFEHTAYSSPFVISASLFLLLAFANAPFQNKVVNWIASSVFSIYLVQMHPMVMPYFQQAMGDAFHRMGGAFYILYALGVAIAMGMVCVLVDKIRIVSWQAICKSFLDKALEKSR